MDLFELTGTVALDASQANKSIDSVTNEAKKIGTGFEQGNTSAKRSLAEIAAENGKTVNQLRSEASKIAAEYRKQGMDASAAMKKAYSDIGYESGSTTDKISSDAKKAESEAKKSFSSIGDSASKIGIGVVAVGTALSGAFIAAVEGTRDYRAQMGLLDSAFTEAGHSSEVAKKTYSDLNAVMGDTEAAVEASQHLANICDNEEELADLTNTMTGIYAEFGASLPLEGLSEAILHSSQLGEVQGNLADALEWSGITVEDFNDQLAKCSTVEERQDLIANTLRETYSKSSEQYKETNKDVMEARKAQEKLTDAFAELGAVGEPIMTKIKEKVAEFVSAAVPKIEEFIQKVKDCIKWIKENENTINAWVGVIIGATVSVSGFLLVLNWGTIMSKAKTALTLVTTAVKAFNIALKANPIGLVITLIAGLVTAFIYLWNNCEPFREFWINLWKKIQDVTSNTVNAVKKWWNNMSDDMKEKFDSMKQKATEIFSSIKNTISEKVQAAKDLASAAFLKLKANIISPIIEAKNRVVELFGTIYSTIKGKIESAKEVVEKAMNKIKGFFPLSIGKIFSNLKIPSISVSGGKAPYGIAGKGKLPSFDVKWNAKGAIFDKPTVLPSVEGLQGVGEAGAEAITPIETLLTYVTEAVRSQNEPILNYMRNIVAMMAEYMPQMAQNNAEIILDGNALVGRLAPRIDQELGILANRKTRGNT